MDVLWCTDQQKKVIKWTTAWERWMNQQNLASNYLKQTPVKQAFIFYYLWLLWAAYENILHSVCHLWSNAVVVLNTSLLWLCKCLNWFVSRKWPVQLIRPFLEALYYWIIQYYCHSHACAVLEQFIMCAYQGCMLFRIELKMPFKFQFNYWVCIGSKQDA